VGFPRDASLGKGHGDRVSMVVWQRFKGKTSNNAKKYSHNFLYEY